MKTLFIYTSSESSNVGGIIGGVIGGIAVLAIVMVGVLLVGVYLARRKPGNGNWRYSSMLPTNTTTSASTALEFLDDEGPLMGAEPENEPDVKSSENK